MAKQTKKGGAYANYQIIKNGDTTGSSRALAEGMAGIAGTLAQNSKDLHAARKKEIERVEQSKRDLRAKGQIRTDEAQKTLLNANTAIEGSSLSEDLQKDYTVAFQSLTNRVGEAGAVLDNNDSTDEEKKQANADIFNARKSINSLNMSLEKSKEMQVAAHTNIANRQSSGVQWDFSSIDVAETDFDTFEGDLKPGDPNYDITKPFNGAVPKNKMVSDNGSTMEGWNAAQIGSKGTSMYLTERDGEFFLGGSGSLNVEGKEESWKYETDIGSYNNPKYSTTTKYTQLIPKASQQVVDQMYMKDANGKSTGKIDPSLVMSDVKPYLHTDGVQYEEIKKDTFDANIESAAGVAKSQFDAINNVQNRNNIVVSELRLTTEEGNNLFNSDLKISGPATETLRTAIQEKIRGEALASLNLKEIGDKLYKVSDVQPKKPTVTKATVKEKDRRSTLNTISKTFDEYGNFDNAKDFGEGLTTALMLDNDFTVNKDGNIMKQSNKLDEIAMDKLPADSKEEIFESETWIINGPDPISNRKNLINLLLSKHSNLSSSQADDLAKKLLKKKPAQK
tara:strand:- start:294 stop:1985 length:1692 start_codon:yes stop_codon:yes gene_type:complete